MNFDRPEDIYPLSPMQQGMLFTTLQLPSSGVCFEQDHFTLRGDLDVERFRHAWEQTVARHPVLRTTFLWEDIEEPHQIVHRKGIVELQAHDLRDALPGEQKQKIDEYASGARRRGFDLTALPLMRLDLFRLAEKEHQLVWNFHHAILDGWSLPLVMKDVLEFYAADGKSNALRLQTTRPYRDFIGWLLQKDQQSAESFWRRRLAGFTGPTPLNVDRRIPLDAPVTDETFQRSFHEIPGPVTEALTAFAKSHHLTLSTVVYGAWALLLRRYSGTEDIVFGCNISGRSPEISGIEDMVGLFINTLPLRVGGASNMALVPWLKSIQAQLVELQEYDFSPLVQVQKWSQVGAGRSLFDSIVVFENYPTVSPKGGNSALEIAYQPWTRHSKTGYPLTLLVLPGKELRLEIKFDTRRFDRSSIERMLGHLQVLLQGIAEPSSTNIGEIPLLDARERTELIEGFNQPAPRTTSLKCPTDGGATLCELFEAQVARTPETVALTCDSKSLSYAELNALSNRLARQLVSRGVKPDTLVGLCLDRSNDLVIALLAILKAGGAYLPIDLAYPADRLAFMLEDAQAPVLLTESKLVGDLPRTRATVLCVDEILARPCQPGEESNLAPIACPDNLAYVIYTSGTTGKPKGSLITHRNVVRLFPATEPWYEFNEQDVWTLFHSCAFDFSVWEIWGALLYGGRVVVVPFLVSRSPEAFYHLLAKERVTVLNQTPSAFRQLIQAEESVGQKDLALRYVVFGGEALEMQSLRPWFERHGDQKPRLINMYGITETTVHVTYRPLLMDDLNSGSVIGVPIPDLQVYILDAQGQPVPIGVPGEMHVGGGGLARGYLRRPELTAERFIPNHLTGRPGARLYKTGDLARFLPGRDIEYLGRIDNQVKIRGFRIELGEIESVLCQHPAVREAAVIAREDAPGAKRLTAYVVASQPAPGVTILRDHLKKKLPDYMVPAAFVFLEKLPLTTNGKIDIKALPIPEHRPELGSRYVAPSSSAEKTLAAIWSKVLRVEHVGVNDNFFELGGDSILSIQIISMARREGLKLSPRLLFAHQTVAELAAAAGAAEDTQRTPEIFAGDVPLTPIQHWFFEQDLVDVHHYNQAFLLEVGEKLDRSVLGRSLRELSRHHDALRLRFARESSGWRQFYSATDEPAEVIWTDISHLGAAEKPQAIEATAASVEASLNLQNGPLWRVAYFNLGEGEPARMLIVVHHMAVDGISWRPLLEDLETIYRQLASGQSPNLPAKTASFKSWAARLTELGRSGSLDGEFAYWQEVTDPNRMAEASRAVQPREGHEANTEGSASTLSVSLTADETQALLQKVPTVYKTQINDVLLTALARAWSRGGGGNVLYANLEGHGRESLFDDLDISRTVGWFTSIFPVRLELPATESDWMPGEALISIKEQIREIPERGVGYGILRYLGGAADLSGRPEPPLIFNYLGQFDQVLAGSTLFRFAGESAGPWHSPSQRRRSLLEINSWVKDGRLEISWTYSQRLHSSDAIQQLADEYLMALRGLINHCLSEETRRYTPSDFPLARLDQQTLDQLVSGQGEVEDIYPLSPIQTLFFSSNHGAPASTFDQWHCTLLGDLDRSAFQRAWQETVQRHTILRSTIHSEGLREPLQIVHREVRLPWTIEDWRSLPRDRQEEAWSSYLKNDRSQPLLMASAPAMRFALIRLASDKWKFLWSVPALLLDGWSWPLVFRDASRLYEAFVRNAAPQLEPVRPYHDYLEWLERQSPEDSNAFWRQNLAGFKMPTLLPGRDPDFDANGERYPEHSVRLSKESTAALQSAARGLQVTLNTLIEGAWALLLSHETGAAEVVFGAAFAGRPADLHGVESIVGPFVNNLPVRVGVNMDSPVNEFFRRVHSKSLELNAFQFTPLMDIQRCSEVPWRHRLFDSLIVFQNYLVDDSARCFGGQIEISQFAGPVHTNFPVLLLAEPGAEFRLALIYDREKVAHSTVERWGHDLKLLLDRIPEYTDKNLADLRLLLSPPPSPNVRAKRRLYTPSQNFVPPQTELEHAIAGVWQKMFELEKISTEENFFDLGGHSLLLVQMHSQLKETLKTDIPIVLLFEHPTVRSLARHLAQPDTSASNKAEQWHDRAEQQRKALAQMRMALKK